MVETITPTHDLEVVTRRKLLLHNFFKGYRSVDIDSDEILTEIFVPFPQDSSHFHIFGFKQSRRREDDIAIVNAGISVLFECEGGNVQGNNEKEDSDVVVGDHFVARETVNSGEKENGEQRWDSFSVKEDGGSCMSQQSANPPVVKRLIVAYGGMAPTTKICVELMDFWKGKKWTFESLVESVPVLLRVTELPDDAPGGQVVYRRRLARNFFIKFFFQVAIEAGVRVDVSLPLMRDKFSDGWGVASLLLPFVGRRGNAELTSGHLPSHPTYKYEAEPCRGLQVSVFVCV